MTDTATGPVATQIRRRLTEALSPEKLEVINDSHHHAGHMGDDGSGESHFTVIVQSRHFLSKSRVERQRMVNQELADLLAEKIHALSIRASAPDEG